MLYNRPRLSSNYSVQNLSFANHNRGKLTVNNFCWATIIPSNEDESTKSYKVSPQIVLSFTQDGVNCSFSYGGSVSNQSDFVLKVKEKLPSLIASIDKENIWFRIRKSEPYFESPLRELTIQDLASRWNRDSQLISKVSPNNLTAKQMNERIVLELEKYIHFFMEAVSAN